MWVYANATASNRSAFTGKVHRIITDGVDFSADVCEWDEAGKFEEYINILAAKMGDLRHAHVKGCLLATASKKIVDEFLNDDLFDSNRRQNVTSPVTQCLFLIRRAEALLGEAEMLGDDNSCHCVPNAKDVLVLRTAWAYAHQSLVAAKALEAALNPDADSWADMATLVYDKYMEAILEAERSQDLLLQGEIECHLGTLYYRFYEVQRADHHLKRSVQLGLSYFANPNGAVERTQLYSLSWFQEAKEIVHVISDDRWIRDAAEEERDRDALLAELKVEIDALREARTGGPIMGGLKFIGHVFYTHPPRVTDPQKVAVIREVLDIER